MTDKFTYNELKEMSEEFEQENASLELRTEVIKAICELPEINIDWLLLENCNNKILRYYADNPEKLPRDPWMFKRMLTIDAKECGIYLTKVQEV